LFKILKGGFNTAVDWLAAFPMILSNLYFKDACQNFAKHLWNTNCWES
jgi:hypothetical protein